VFISGIFQRFVFIVCDRKYRLWLWEGSVEALAVDSMQADLFTGCWSVSWSLIKLNGFSWVLMVWEKTTEAIDQWKCGMVATFMYPLFCELCICYCHEDRYGFHAHK
jgi:hypothetical protein